MDTPTLTPPRRTAGPRSPAPVPQRPRQPVSAARHHQTERRVWKWALGLSVLVHLLVLVISPVFLRVGFPPGQSDTAEETSGSSGMRMVDLAASPEIPSEPVSVPVESLDPDVPTSFPRSDRAQPPTPRQGEAAPGRPSGVQRGDAAETRPNPLQPGLRDPRLWIPPRDVPKREPTQEELHAEYMAGLEVRLRTWNDSIAGEADRARRATDWTVRDGSGGRWGVSPEGIHLGGVTLPPTTFTPGGGDPDRRARVEEQERSRREIDRQQADQERRQVREERTRATRERRDQEREQQNRQ